MKNIKLTTLLAIVAITLTSCVSSFNGVKGNDQVTTEKRKVNGDFDKISVSDGIDLIISIDSKPSIEIKADENLQELIKTEVRDGVLKIYSEKNIWHSKSRKAYVSLPSLNGLKASAGASAKSDQLIKSAQMSLSSSSGSTIKLALQSKNISADASSGSTIKLEGSTENFKGSASSGSSIRCQDLKSQSADVKVSSGAGLKIHSSKEIKARASSGASIRYYGSPEFVDSDSSSGGSVNNAD
ncbi:MAG: head GIN domain-containing protein [Flavobacteriaceae bacterium]